MRQNIGKKELEHLSDDELNELLTHNRQRPRVITMPTVDRICALLNYRESLRVEARWAWEDAHGEINTKTAWKAA
jgi:hypothetical protein